MLEKSAQPKYKRQRFLLAFIHQLKDTVTATDLQNLIFLHSMEEGSEHYQFIPHRSGCRSFQLVEDIEILCRDGFLKDGR